MGPMPQIVEEEEGDMEQGNLSNDNLLLKQGNRLFTTVPTPDVPVIAPTMTTSQQLVKGPSGVYLPKTRNPSPHTFVILKMCSPRNPLTHFQSEGLGTMPLNWSWEQSHPHARCTPSHPANNYSWMDS